MMNRFKHARPRGGVTAVAVPALAVLSVLVLGLQTGCKPSTADRLQGYLEGEYVHVASPLGGAVEKLSVQRGHQVKVGDPLFTLESVSEKAARDEAARRLAQAHAALEDAKKGKRPSEVDALTAGLKQVQAALELAEMEFTRQQALREAGASAQHELDAARSVREQHRARVRSLEADLETARLGARVDQVAAAEANVRALEAALRKTEWSLAQKVQSAPCAGLVFDTLFREGEWVAAGRPVVMLLPPANIKLRVFVSETIVGSLHLGDAVQVFMDGVVGGITGRVSFISPQAEYSPPMIYSRANRQKFVYLVEATFEPDVAARLHPGQPVEVVFPPGRQP